MKLTAITRHNAANYGSIPILLASSPSSLRSQRSSQNAYLWIRIAFPGIVIVALFSLTALVSRGNRKQHLMDQVRDEKIVSSSRTSSHSYQRTHNKSYSKTCAFSNVVCSREECYVLPSEYETCLESISLEVDHVVQTIRALDKIFEQYYVFYYIARNATPPNGSHIDYEIYDKEPVDLHALLEDIVYTVKTRKSASVSTFWDVTHVFRSLRDAHVTAIQGNLGSLDSEFFSGMYTLEVAPLRRWSNMIQNGKKHTEKIKTIFYYSQDGEIQLDVEYHRNETVSKRSVMYIDCQSPKQFLLRLADTTMSGVSLKSIGPRVNSLIAFHFPSTESDAAFFWTGRGRREHITPGRIVPDSFVVQYNDGTREIFSARVLLRSSDCPSHNDIFSERLHDVLEINVSKIEAHLNEPSCLYRNFLTGTRKVEKAVEALLPRSKLDITMPSVGISRAIDEDTNHSHQYHGDLLERFCNVSLTGWFTKAYRCSGFDPPYDGDGPLEAAYRLMEGYMLFRLDSFDAPPDVFVDLWREVNEAAKRNGLDRLMFDITSNGGGEVPAGMNLARLMFPECSCEMFTNKYDIVYSKPMGIWATQVQPILSNLDERWFKKEKELSKREKRTILSHLTREKGNKVVAIAKALCILDLDHDHTYCGNVNAAVKKNCTLLRAAQSLQKDKSLASLTKVVRELLTNYLNESTPWTVATAFDVPVTKTFETYERGGILANFTQKDRPEWNCSAMEIGPNASVFSTYVLVGSGNSGSTANTFQSTVEQLWKHRSLSGAIRSLVTVSYGGLDGDIPLTQFAGGSVLGRVNVEDAFVGLAGVHLLGTLFQPEHPLQTVIRRLETSLPEVPFFLQKFPKMTAVEIYNRFLLDGMVPLEYLNVPPDRYIPQIYVGSIFDHPELLVDLYEEASKYLLQSGSNIYHE